MKAIRIFLVASLALATLGLASSALAQDGSGEDSPPDVLNEGFGPDEGPQDLGPQPAVQPSGGVLPFTGAQLSLFVVAGIVAIGAGVALVRRGRSSGRSETG